MADAMVERDDVVEWCAVMFGRQWEAGDGSSAGSFENGSSTR